MKRTLYFLPLMALTLLCSCDNLINNTASLEVVNATNETFVIFFNNNPSENWVILGNSTSDIRPENMQDITDIQIYNSTGSLYYDWSDLNFKDGHNYKMYLDNNTTENFICDRNNTLEITNKSNQQYAIVYVGLANALASVNPGKTENINLVEDKTQINANYLIMNVCIPIGIITKTASSASVDHAYLALDKFFNDGTYTLNISNNKAEMHSQNYNIDGKFYDLINFSENDCEQLLNQLVQYPFFEDGLITLCKNSSEINYLFEQAMKKTLSNTLNNNPDVVEHVTDLFKELGISVQ